MSAVLAMLVSAAAAAAPAVEVPASKVLVLAPEPAGDVGATGWIGETIADVLPRDLERLGVPAVSRADRLAAHEALDIPVVTLSRATSIRFAEALGVSRIVSGTFERRGSDVTVSLRWLDVERGTLSPSFNSSSSLDSLPMLVHGLAWDIALAGPWKPRGTRDTFLASLGPLPFTAFESYGMGLAAAKPGSRREHLKRALARHAAFDEARVALAREEIDAREYLAAHETLAAVPATSPLARDALFLQGVALLEMARYDEANALHARLSENDATPGVLSNHGLAMLRARGRGRGSELLRRAVEKAPGVTDLAFNLGWALLVEGDAEAATFWLRGVTRQAPRDARARVILSWALRAAGHLDEAAAEWRGVALTGAREGLTEAPDLSRRLGRVMLAERPVVIERSDVELAVAHVGRADALLKANDSEGALRELTRAAYLDPYSARAHELLARVHLQRGEREKAVGELQMSLWCRSDATLRVLLARLLAELGRHGEAKAEAEKVLQDDPANEAARTLLKSPAPDL